MKSSCFLSFFVRLLALPVFFSLTLVAIAEWPLNEIRYRDAEVLKAAGLDNRVESLLTRLEGYFPAKAPLANFDELIRKLGDEDFSKREKVMGELLQGGAGIVSRLQQAEKNRDPEIAARVKILLEKLDTRSGNSSTSAAALRALGELAPLRGLEIAKRLLKEKEDNLVLRDALLDFFIKAVKADPGCRDEFVKHLASSDRRLRVFAIQALGFSGEKLEALLPLLNDPDKGIRNHAGLSLLQNGKKEALLPIIRNLGVGPRQQSFLMANLLAGLTESAEAKKHLAAENPNWNAIQQALETKGINLDLGKNPQGKCLLTVHLAAVANLSSGGGAIHSILPDGTHQKLFDVQILPLAVDAVGHSLVVVQESSRVVQVRNLLGEILSSHDEKSILVGTRVGHQGRRFFFFRTALSSADFNGENALVTGGPNNFLAGGTLWKNKEPVMVTRDGKLETFDQKGNKQGSIQLPLKNATTLYLEGTAEGRLLIAPLSGNKVEEYDAKGQLTRSWPVQANTMLLLPNGNLLAGSRLKNLLAEYDSQGREIRNWKLDARIYKTCSQELRHLPREPAAP